jgi:hypothetical protein
MLGLDVLRFVEVLKSANPGSMGCAGKRDKGKMRCDGFGETG